MSDFWLAARVHPALLGAGAMAPDFELGPGMNTVDFEGATPDLAPDAALAFIGTPGADKTAAGRVTDAAVGAGLPVAVVVAALVAAAAVAALAAGPGAAGEPDDAPGGTVAVIE